MLRSGYTIILQYKGINVFSLISDDIIFDIDRAEHNIYQSRNYSQDPYQSNM